MQMNQLCPVERLIVEVLADNLTDSYSSKPGNCSPEFNNVMNAGATEISGATLCCAQLGLALMLTAESGAIRHKLLFDTGPDGAVLIANAARLGVSFGEVNAIAITHGHWDHMGGLVAAIDAVRRDDHARHVPCHVNPGMFLKRGARLSNGTIAPFQKVPSPSALAAHGAEVVNSGEARTLLDDFFYLSGEIPRLSEFETGRDDHFCRDRNSSPWRPDPLIMDERFLAVNVRGKGMIVFSACSHAGIVNVLLDVRQKFPEVPIHTVIGGLHLGGATMEKRIAPTVANLKQFDCKQIIPAHCSGWRAVRALANEFGESIVSQSAVGNRYVI